MGRLEPGGADQPCLGSGLAAGHVEYAEGQFTGPQTAADQQMARRRGGAQPRPRGTSGRPWTPFRRQRVSQRRAPFSSRRTACAHVRRVPLAWREVEVRADPQRIPLAAGGEILPWRGLRPCARPGPAVTVEGWLALTAVGGDAARRASRDRPPAPRTWVVGGLRSAGSPRNECRVISCGTVAEVFEPGQKVTAPRRQFAVGDLEAFGADAQLAPAVERAAGHSPELGTHLRDPSSARLQDG